MHPTPLGREKPAQRNITPSFLAVKTTSRPKAGKNVYKNPDTEKSEDTNHQARTNRSNSRTSKCSLEALDAVVLHLSRPKNKAIVKGKGPENNDAIRIMPNNTFDQAHDPEDPRRTHSNSNKKDKPGRENNVYIGLGRKSQIEQQQTLNRKKSSGSGKIIFRPYNRSNSKRDQQSLDKEQKMAKAKNVDLMAQLMKHTQAPNYIYKIRKNKESEKEPVKERKKQGTRSHLLNLDINIKGPEALAEYQVYGELGKGAYGVVRMGINKKSGQKVAIKFYPKKSLNEMNRLKNLQRQINILASLDYPIIAKLIEAIQTPTDIYLVLQYGGANSLYNYLLSKNEHRLKEHEAKKFLQVIAQTIRYLHRKDIVHRDIKAQNILINRYKDLKLIDFGFSIHSVPPNTIDTFCGTPTYMAPQIVSKVDHIPIYTDMWSLGILYYVMVQGNYPFRSRNEEDLFQKIKRGKFEYIHNDISEQSKKFIEALLQVNPYSRLTVEDIFSPRWSGFFLDARLEQITQ